MQGEASKDDGSSLGLWLESRAFVRRVQEKFVPHQSEVFERFLEIIQAHKVCCESASTDHDLKRVRVIQRLLDLFHGHDDLITSLKSIWGVAPSEMESQGEPGSILSPPPGSPARREAHAEKKAVPNEGGRAGVNDETLAHGGGVPPPIPPHARCGAETWGGMDWGQASKPDISCQWSFGQSTLGRQKRDRDSLFKSDCLSTYTKDKQGQQTPERSEDTEILEGETMNSANATAEGISAPVADSHGAQGELILDHAVGDGSKDIGGEEDHKKDEEKKISSPQQYPRPGPFSNGPGRGYCLGEDPSGAEIHPGKTSSWMGHSGDSHPTPAPKSASPSGTAQVDGIARAGGLSGWGDWGGMCWGAVGGGGGPSTGGFSQNCTSSGASWSFGASTPLTKKKSEDREETQKSQSHTRTPLRFKSEGEATVQIRNRTQESVKGKEQEENADTAQAQEQEEGMEQEVVEARGGPASQPASSGPLALEGAKMVSRVVAAEGAGSGGESPRMSSSSSSAMHSNVSGAKRSGRGEGLGVGDGGRGAKRRSKQSASATRDSAVRDPRASYNQFTVCLDVDVRIVEMMGVHQYETKRFQGLREEERNVLSCLPQTLCESGFACLH